MRKIINIILSVVLAFSSLIFTGCNNDEEDVLTLNVYNWEDYICRDENDDLIATFEEFATAKYGKKVVVNYSTFGTNENMYNELQLSKVKTENGSYDYGYDLVCPSDYMIQKMISEDMLEKLDPTIKEGEKGSLSNYYKYSSKYILDLFDGYGWTDYACGYMYGTMGFVYNPEVLSRSGEYVEGDESHWDFPWKTYSKNLGTIKDSIRDTYALALGKVYTEELSALANQYKNNELTDEKYQEKLVEIFNRTDEETVEKVTKELIELKANVYGFEVDSGKRDMASGKIAINFAWSGDAVYTLDIAEEDGTILYYTVPEEGSNIWFDGWVMPKGANVLLAQEFINFLASPENAVLNMNYIGYTPVVSGETMLENAIDWYGTWILLETDEPSLDSVFLNGKYYDEYYFQDALDEGLIEETPNDVYDIIYPVYDDDDNVIGLEEEKDVQLYRYDVSFLLNTRENQDDMFIWTDTLGRQLETQYPQKDTVIRCAIMKNFTDAEMKRLNNMWDEVKVSAIPSWLMWMIVIVLVLVIIIAPILSHLNKKGVRINFKRKNNNLTLIKKEEIKN